jgi:hypothetical protein
LLTAQSALGVVVCLAVYGAFAGLVDLTMNAEGARVERALARPVFAGLHGGCSAGTALGAIAGSLIAVNVGSWLSAIIGCCVFAGATGLIFAVTPEGGADHTHDGPSGRRALLSRMLVVLGVVIGVSIASEGAALYWSTLLLQSEAPSLAAVSGLGAAFFCGCQAALRLNADRVRRLVSDRRLIVVSLAVAAVGFMIVALDAGFAASVVGFAIIGIGHRCGGAVRLRARRLGSRVLSRCGAIHRRAVRRAGAPAGAPRDGRRRQLFFSRWRFQPVRHPSGARPWRDAPFRQQRLIAPSRGALFAARLPQ